MPSQEEIDAVERHEERRRAWLDDLARMNRAKWSLVFALLGIAVALAPLPIPLRAVSIPLGLASLGMLRPRRRRARAAGSHRRTTRTLNAVQEWRLQVRRLITAEEENGEDRYMLFQLIDDDGLWFVTYQSSCNQVPGQPLPDRWRTNTRLVFDPSTNIALTVESTGEEVPSEDISLWECPTGIELPAVLERKVVERRMSRGRR
jgi:hypothetical protein